METIHLDLNQEEVGVLIFALGACYKLPEAWPLAQRVLRLASHSSLPTGAASIGLPAAGGSAPAPAAPAPPPPPANGELTITPVEVEQSQDGKSMVVTYKVRSGSTVKTKTVRTWDPTLFSTLLARKGVTTTFVVKESAHGFLNIVGVK